MKSIMIIHDEDYDKNFIMMSMDRILMAKK